MKNYTTQVSHSCQHCGTESVIAVEHDYGASYYGQTEQLYSAEIVQHGCECQAEAAVEDAAVRMVEG